VIEWTRLQQPPNPDYNKEEQIRDSRQKHKARIVDFLASVLLPGPDEW